MRNLALSLARGQLIRMIDHDDIMLPGALWRDIRTMDAHPDIAFCTSSTINNDPSGEYDGGWLDPPEGPLELGQIYNWWRERDCVIPIHPATACVRTAHLRAVGGWMALQPMTEDVGMLVALNELWPGWFNSKRSLEYRIWPDQTSTPLTEDDPVRQASCEAVSQRAKALRALRKQMS